MPGIYNTKFLGVKSRTNKEAKTYFLCDIYDEGNITLRCNESVYEKGMRIPFGASIDLVIQLGAYNNQPIIRAEDIAESKKNG